MEIIGVTGGINRFLGYFYNNYLDKLFAFATTEKLYFWGINWRGRGLGFFIFYFKLRKWCREMQPENEAEYLKYFLAKDSGLPAVYAINAEKRVYEISFEPPLDEYGHHVFYNGDVRGYDITVSQHDGVISSVYEPIKFYLKTKEFKNGTLSKQKNLSKIYFNYDLSGYTSSQKAQVNIKIITNDGRTKECKNALPEGTNLTKCILIPNDMQNADSYTFEIYGQGFIRIYAMERIDRTDTR